MQKSLPTMFLRRVLLSALVFFLILPVSAQSTNFEPIAPGLGPHA